MTTFATALRQDTMEGIVKNVSSVHCAYHACFLHVFIIEYRFSEPFLNLHLLILLFLPDSVLVHLVL